MEHELSDQKKYT